MTLDSTLLAAGQRLLMHVVDLAPGLLGALLILSGGVVVAWLARRAVTAAVRRSGLESFAERHGVVKVLYALRLRSSLPELLGQGVGLAILLVTAMSVAETLGLPGVADGFATVVEFLPRLVAAGIVALAGFVAADIASRVAEGMASRREDLIAPTLLGSALYYLVLAVFLTTAVQHLGLDIDLVDRLLVALVGIAVGSAGLSLALGSQGLVRDVLARQYARHLFQPGDVVTVGESTGTVVRFDAVTVTLRAEDGSLTVLPCHVLLADEGVRIEAPSKDA